MRAEHWEILGDRKRKGATPDTFWVGMLTLAQKVTPCLNALSFKRLPANL